MPQDLPRVQLEAAVERTNRANFQPFACVQILHAAVKLQIKSSVLSKVSSGCLPLFSCPPRPSIKAFSLPFSLSFLGSQGDQTELSSKA